ncbi:undecaprenyl-diphosphate phosphatase [Pseudoruminococcus massiliensis]|uniref:undecaprenyl-diphosphate phosphatase n=1 Tax=Pseudoruminococcus massiliensis TaxID=2086583 RepID=UPI000D0EB853|nr:undecaprenyl-diphosphate phosphatase [Pseudoruminococcus massiliensis]
MNIFEAIVLGAVQGLTEFLPVSSSGHLAIFQHFFGLNDNNLFFNVMLHVGTLTAVCAVYWRLFLRLIKSFFMILKKIFTGKFKWSEMDADENLVMMIIIGLLPLFLLFLPIGGGMKIKDLADKWNSDGYLIITSISLLVTSFLLVIGINANRKTTILYKSHGKLRADGAGRRKLNPVDAVFIGLFQAVAAIFPGISRSGSTLTAGEFRKINKQRALDYSFVLGTPAIIAAALLEGKDALFPADGSAVAIEFLPTLIGIITSAIVGFLAIRLFKWLLSTNRMYYFVLYTAGAGIICLVISIIELISGVNLFTQQPLTF